jgi:hypothetical protein
MSNPAGPRYLAPMVRMRGFGPGRAGWQAQAGRLTLIAAVTGILGLTLAGCHTASAASPTTSATSASPAASATSPAATASPSLSVPGTHKSTTVYRISSPVATVVVIGHVGDVTIIGGGSATLVTQQAAYSRTPPVTSRIINGRMLTVTYRCPAQPVCGVAYVIQVPRDAAVRAATGAGSIRLSGLAGNVTAKTDIGYITATGLADKLVSLTTDVGGISATFTATPAAVDALATAGAITLRVPRSGSYKVSVHDHLGRVIVTVRQSSSASRTITAATDIGAVIVAPLA